MGKANFTEEFKRDAVRQITERGYPVAEVPRGGRRAGKGGRSAVTRRAISYNPHE